MRDQIINLLKQHANHLTRVELWNKLSLPDGDPTDEYWETEQKLVDEKRIERRRGRNGGIYLADESALKPPSDANTAGEIVAEEIREAAHYEPVLKAILSNWAKQPGLKSVFGAITAAQGRRRTGGRWSRPDIIICTVSEWLFSSRPDGDVRTFEIKRFESLDALAVYEALSHKARAHYSYLFVADFPHDLDESQKADFDNVLAVAARHGVGVITATNSSDWSTWEFELDARKSDADSQAINQTLLDQLPPGVRGAFCQALRTAVV